MLVFPLADLRDGNLRQAIDFVGREADGSGPFHGGHHLVEDLGHHEDFLFGDAEQVVVVGGPADDGPGGPIQLGRLVDHHGGIARTGHDRSFPAVEGCAGDRRTSRHADQGDVAMLEDGLGGLQRGLGDDADQIVDAEVLGDRLVESPHAFRRDPLAAGVGIDDQRVAGGDHVDGVAGEGGERVGHGRDGPDDPEGCVFDHRQAMVATEHLAPHELHAGGAFAERLELLDLVLEASDLRLLHLHRSQLDALIDGNAADVLDDASAIFERPPGQLFERVPSRGHGLLHAGEDTIASGEAGPAVRGRSADLGQHLGHDLANERFIDLHILQIMVPVAAA